MLVNQIKFQLINYTVNHGPHFNVYHVYIFIFSVLKFFLDSALKMKL